MTNEEKSTEIVKATSYLPNLSEFEAMQHCAMEMAEWKDKEYNECKKDILTLVNLIPCNEENESLINDIKNLLK